MRRVKLLYQRDEKIDNLILFYKGKKNTAVTGSEAEIVNIERTALEHNMSYTKDLFNIKLNRIKKKINQFTGQKISFILYPLYSLDFLDFKKSKVLSIGPRTEGELFMIKSFGFKWKNIKAIDLQTYSNLVTLNDMHEISFADNSFDIIVSGWTLAYSNNINKAMDEIQRVAKNGCMICIGFTYYPKKDIIDSNRKEENFLYSTEQIKNKFSKVLDKVYFEVNPHSINKNLSRKAIIIFRIKK